MFGNGNGTGTQKDSEEMTIYMGKNIEFKGTLSFEGTGRIDGKVEGKILAKGVLLLGEGAAVSSEIEGDTVIVGGNVEGKITGRQRVQLLKSAVVNAEIVAPAFSIEEGCRFNGTCRMPGGADAASIIRRSEQEEKFSPVMAAR
ncbi:MAG TPA: polymer-forming cytoskeletal protein [Nitrospiria bacterium]|nr:polymer-forming cytoskeletal protein [Nitrospiria bacterium]